MRGRCVRFAALVACVLGLATNCAALKLEQEKLPVGSKLCRAAYKTPDEKFVFVTHMLGRFWLPVTMVERGWCHNSALSVFDGRTGAYIATVLLDDPDLGACEPWGIAADDKQIVVAHAGTSELSIIDRAAFEKRLAERKGKDLTTDMSFMAGIRKRVKTPKQGPRRVRLVAGKPQVTEYLQDKKGITKGELLFNDARLCHQQWQSCATCHPEGRSDKQLWSFPRKVGFNPPEETCDFATLDMDEKQIYARMKRSMAPALFAEMPDAVSIEMGKYVKSVRQRGASVGAGPGK